MALLKIKRKGERSSGVDDNHAALHIAPVQKTELGISDDAAKYVADLSSKKDSFKNYLRVAIRGGGCSGMSIHYEFTDTLRDNDVVFTKNNAHVIIDKKSLSILGGATLHCRDYLGSKELRLVNNPAAKLCSCGQSFAL